MRFFTGFRGFVAILSILTLTPGQAFPQEFISCEALQGRPPSSPRFSLPIVRPSHFLTLLTWSDAEERFESVRRAYRARNFPTASKLKLSSTSAINAFVHGTDTIAVTSGLLRTLSHADDLTFIISHEMAHIALKHPHQATADMENAADTLAISILRDLHVDPCASLLTLTSMKHYVPLYSRSLEQRLAYLSQGPSWNCSLFLPSQPPAVSRR